MAASAKTRGQPHVFGIRHHGPGCAATLRAALEELQPELLLIEGPPEADALIPFASAPGMRPPLAILTYPAKDPERARFHPFAEYSPEWVALRWANEHGVPARFIDLPMAAEAEPTQNDGDDDHVDKHDLRPEEVTEEDPRLGYRRDPLSQLARAAGHSDGEAWWNALVEQAPHAPGVFGAIHDAMAALRAEEERHSPSVGRPAALGDREGEARREAHMRLEIRKALQVVTGPVGVVCGAWHAPALTEQRSLASDRATLKAFRRASKVECCWVPWTDPRLASGSGYGAGVLAPGWYRHLWRSFAAGESPQSSAATARWQAMVAGALREAGHPAATSSVIDATRLAISLSSLRGHPVPGLSEMADASLAALCAGERALLELIEARLLIGDRVGEVDESVPQLPLLTDLQRQLKQLRLQPGAEPRDLALDLRSTAGMAKSEFFWRLQLLGLPLFELVDAAAGRGTAREIWRMQWVPEVTVKLAEAIVHGPTIAQASAHAAVARARATRDPIELARLVQSGLFANLPEAAEVAIVCLRAASLGPGSSLRELMRALPDLARVLRYGTARELPLGPLRELVDGIVAQVESGLVYAAIGLDRSEGHELLQVAWSFDAAVQLLDSDVQTDQWQRGLAPLPDDHGVPSILRGGIARILYARGCSSPPETADRLSRALSPSVPVAEAGDWLEGFLESSGEVLLHDDALLGTVDAWIERQDEETFLEQLPMLRRALSSFDPSLRRRLLNRLADQPALGAPRAEASAMECDPGEAAAFARALPLLHRILGLPAPQDEGAAPRGEEETS